MLGLTLPNKGCFGDIAKGTQTPPWLNHAKTLSAITGNNTFINLGSGLKNLQNFLFRTPKWPIGGVYFDGIIKTEHTRRVKATQHPVQTGINITDHAILESAELTIEIFMSDANSNAPFSVGNAFLDQAISIFRKVSPLANGKGFLGSGETRSIDAWLALKKMQIDRIPIDVETRLDTYNHMIIEELSAPDDVKTLYALKATVRLREIVVAQVAEVEVSARSQVTEETNSGDVRTVPLDNAGKETLAKKGMDGLSGDKN